MGLFEHFDDYDEPGGDDKNRLFETHKSSSRSARDYLKLFAAVVIAVVAIGGAIVYFTMPGIGDEVRPPQGLDASVRAHFLEREKRAVEAVSYFTCGDHYWARVGLEKRPDITARQLDEGHRRVEAVETSAGVWQITSAPLSSPGSAQPCGR